MATGNTGILGRIIAALAATVALAKTTEADVVSLKDEVAALRAELDELKGAQSPDTAPLDAIESAIAPRPVVAVAELGSTSTGAVGADTSADTADETEHDLEAEPGALAPSVSVATGLATGPGFPGA